MEPVPVVSEEIETELASALLISIAPFVVSAAIEAAARFSAVVLPMPDVALRSMVPAVIVLAPLIAPAVVVSVTVVPVAAMAFARSSPWADVSERSAVVAIAPASVMLPAGARMIIGSRNVTLPTVMPPAWSALPIVMLEAPSLMASLNIACGNAMAIPPPELATPIVVVVVSGCSRMSPVVVMLLVPPAALMPSAVMVIPPPELAEPAAAATLPSVIAVEFVRLMAWPLVVVALTVPARLLLALVSAMVPAPPLKVAAPAPAACVMEPDCVMPTAEMVRVPVPTFDAAS